jgi:hypothetical protein
MWPRHQLALDQGLPSARVGGRRDSHARRERASRILAELLALDPPAANGGDSSGLPVPLLAKALTDLAERVHGRASMEQYAAVNAVAGAYGMDPGALLRQARDIGKMIAKTTHHPRPHLPGEPALNRLLGADLPLASELHLARIQLTSTMAESDPDLPRLWILANGLHHGVPAQVMLTEPAHSRGPLARIVPVHDDLVGWYGVRRAVGQLEATVHAAVDGRRWLATAPDTVSNRLLALGVIDLSHPAPAHQLARAGPSGATIADLRAVADGLPALGHILDLTDEALKAVCDRNNWLLGTADERTGRELVERQLPDAVTAEVRAGLAAGDTRALTVAIVRGAPADAALDAATWRRNPPSLDAAQRRQLLDVSSREAMRRFAGLDIQPPPTKAAAIAARFPDRVARHGTNVTSAELVTGEPSPPPATRQTELDLGL